MSATKLVNIACICVAVSALALFCVFACYCSKYDTSIVPYIREAFHLH